MCYMSLKASALEDRPRGLYCSAACTLSMFKVNGKKISISLPVVMNICHRKGKPNYCVLVLFRSEF